MERTSYSNFCQLMLQKGRGKKPGYRFQLKVITGNYIQESKITSWKRGECPAHEPRGPLILLDLAKKWDFEISLEGAQNLMGEITLVQNRILNAETQRTERNQFFIWW
jgi:hypothetical protein